MRKSIDIRIPPLPKTHNDSDLHEARQALDELLQLYDRRGQPNPNTMGKKAFNRELALLKKLTAARYLPDSCFFRQQQFEREERRRS